MHNENMEGESVFSQGMLDFLGIVQSIISDFLPFLNLFSAVFRENKCKILLIGKKLIP